MARRAGERAVITVGNSVLGLYNLIWMGYTRYMQPDEHLTIKILDDLVQEAQALAHLYSTCMDENPAAAVDTAPQRTMVDDLLQALASFYLAQRHAVSAVATYVSGVYGPVPEFGDF